MRVTISFFMGTRSISLSSFESLETTGCFGTSGRVSALALRLHHSAAQMELDADQMTPTALLSQPAKRYERVTCQAIPKDKCWTSPSLPALLPSKMAAELQRQVQDWHAAQTIHVKMMKIVASTWLQRKTAARPALTLSSCDAA